ncbi:MAG: glycosyltransferase family 39 protein [bacterium]
MRVFLIFLAGLVLRILFIFCFPQPGVVSDASGYDMIGLSIAQGNGFCMDGILTARREPIYPLFLAFVYFVFGHSYLAVRILQAIIGALTCIFVYLIGKRIFGKNCGVLASLFCALYPHLITTTGFVLTETLFTFLLSVSIYFLLKGLEKRKFLILAGIFFGLSTLTRSVTLLFPFFLLVCFLILKKKGAILDFCIISIFMTATIIPWTIRNYIRFHTLIPVAIGGGYVLWPGTYIPWDGDWKYYDLSDMNKLTEGLSEIEADKRLTKQGLKNIRENPFGYIKLCIKKGYRLWFWIPGGKEVLKPYPKIKIGLAIFQYLVIFFALLGIIFGLEKLREYLPILTIILYFTVIHSLLLAIPRYNLPIFPYLFLFCANAIIRIKR